MNILNYGDYLILCYEDNFNLDLFSKIGVCLERHDINHLFMMSNLRLISIDQIQLCRLDWSDRYFDFVQLTYKQIPNKILISGKYEIPEIYEAVENPFIMQLNRNIKNLSIIKAFKSPYKITSLNYGPYDNGHILIGMENGTLIAFNSVDMSKLY